MADVRISQLPAATSPQAGDVAPMVSGGNTVKTTASQLVTAALNATPVTIAQGGTGATTAPAARTALGLGTIATQDASAVAITGGTITGITPLAVPAGGTGANTLTGYVKGNGTGALTASANIPNTDVTGLGTMATQNANAVAITGGTVAGTSVSATTIAASAAVNLNPANASVSLQPTGSGSITVKPTLAGTIDNMSIGTNQAAAGAFTSLGITNTVSLSGSAGTSGQVLTSQGAGLPPVWTTPSGGGGGGAFTSSVAWSTGGTSKNAYIDQTAGTVNNAGIDITLTASSGSGNITNVTVSLNGTALTNTYSSTGTFPTYRITVPVTDIANVAAQTAANVTVSCLGTYDGGNFNVANAGTLTNNQPVPFATTLSGSYAPATLPFYTTTSTINYSYTNATNIITFSGTITPAGGQLANATAASGSFTTQPIAGANIAGSATGKGTVGAGNSTVQLSGSIPAVSVYRPAFYSQTANITPPTITDPSTSTQTTGAAQGSTVTFPVATASTQYDWLITDRPIENIKYVTPFGNVQWVPDVTAQTQNIANVTFNVFGATGLDTTGAVQLVIS